MLVHKLVLKRIKVASSFPFTRPWANVLFSWPDNFRYRCSYFKLGILVKLTPQRNAGTQLVFNSWQNPVFNSDSSLEWNQLKFQPELVDRLVVVDASPVTSPSYVQMTHIINSLISLSFNHTLSLHAVRKHADSDLKQNIPVSIFFNNQGIAFEASIFMPVEKIDFSTGHTIGRGSL